MGLQHVVMSQSLNIYMSMVLILIFKINMVRFIYYNRITLANIISIDTGRLMSLRGKGNLTISKLLNNIKSIFTYSIKGRVHEI